MLRGFWQKVVKAPGAFVSWGLVGEGVWGRRVISGRREIGGECSESAKMEIDRKTACCGQLPYLPYLQ